MELKKTLNNQYNMYACNNLLLVIATLRPIHTRNYFKSATVFNNQEVFSRDTMPTQLLGIYSKCDKPPPLYKLNPYR